MQREISDRWQTRAQRDSLREDTHLRMTQNSSQLIYFHPMIGQQTMPNCVINFPYNMQVILKKKIIIPMNASS